MKFVLIIWVCSFLGGAGCLPPVKHSTAFNSWYECSRAAYKKSGNLLSKMGYSYVNKHYIGIQYHCEPVQTH